MIPFTFGSFSFDVRRTKIIRLCFSANFHLNPTNKEDFLPIRINEVFHVTDTLHNDQVGFWAVSRVRSIDAARNPTGRIPNESRFDKKKDFSVSSRICGSIFQCRRFNKGGANARRTSQNETINAQKKTSLEVRREKVALDSQSQFFQRRFAFRSVFVSNFSRLLANIFFVFLSEKTSCWKRQLEFLFFS